MPRMELIAGEVQDILVTLGAAEVGGTIPARDRFAAHLPLGGGIDPTWLDLLAAAVRAALDSDSPVDFLDARIELGGEDGAVVVERVDPAWVSAVARTPDGSIDAVTGRWIDLLEEETGPMPGEEKPWIRDLAAQVVAFCRDADQARRDVVFVWNLA